MTFGISALGANEKSKASQVNVKQSEVKIPTISFNFDVEKLAHPDGLHLDKNGEDRIYDENGRLMELKNKNGETTKYDKKGQLTEETDKWGYKTAYKYDKQGNIIESKNLSDKDHLLYTYNYKYDSNGQKTQFKSTYRTGEVSELVNYKYDEQGREIESKGHGDYGYYSTKTKWTSNNTYEKTTVSMDETRKETYNADETSNIVKTNHYNNRTEYLTYDKNNMCTYFLQKDPNGDYYESKDIENYPNRQLITEHYEADGYNKITVVNKSTAEETVYYTDKNGNKIEKP